MRKSASGDEISAVAKIISPGMRYLSAAAIVIVLIGMLVGALTIPFSFESPSMWYKFGIEKTSLRTGKLLGLTAALLILLQLPLAGRLKFLDRIFSLPGLIRQHRIHARTIALIALVHPVCVLYAEGMLFVPLQMRYWPEWVGVALLTTIVLQFVCSQWRQGLGLAFHIWMPLHRIGGLLIAALLVVHVLYVSESFTNNWPPRLAVWLAAGVFAAIWLWVRSAWLRARRSPFVVSHVEAAGADCTDVEMLPPAQKPFAYVPGQFAIASFRSQHVSAEPHPFTLSSSPGRPPTIHFTIHACGDWTRKVQNLQPGEKVLIQGPFGRFGHLFTQPDRELIMIAGGIGITPMLSMLRFMADQGDARPVTLIWSTRSLKHVVFADEMETLAARLTGLRCIPIFTRISENGKRSARLDRSSLEELLRDCGRTSAVFLCGPPSMMSQVSNDLRAIGFSSRSIFTEVFGF